MVKPDVKHNYYADLELPVNATCDDIRKAYRKLALQYHPDRNSGRESEVVAKFQAIQAASEVLLDPGTKERYDSDRRKAALYASFAGAGPPRAPTPNSPYAATSAYPPPPRRTQPGSYQRPPSFYPPPPGPTANGADRFSNFPRPGPKKDPAQDRTNVFRAWQNMNNAERPQRPASYAQPPPQSAPRPPTSKVRPTAPPRPDPRMPTEEPKPGPKYNVPPPFHPDAADQRSSAWAAFHATNSGKPGMTRNQTYRTPPRHGFNPSTATSDEKPADGSRYTRTYSSDNLTGMHFNVHGPPPTSEPGNAAPTASPKTPNAQRQYSGDQVPFMEHNRVSTPYAEIYTGVKSDLRNEGLRRSHSTRATTNLSPPEPAETSKARARSSSPPHATPEKSGHRKAFDLNSSSDASDASDADLTGTPEELDNTASGAQQQRPSSTPNAASSSDRPKIVPTGPSKRYANGTSASAQSDTEQQKAKPNIFDYAHNPELYAFNDGKSRSEENINTSFSSDGWRGAFTGDPGYFAPPNGNGRKQPSPARRPSPYHKTSSQQRSATLDVPTPGGTSTANEEVPQRAWGSDGTPSEYPRMAASGEGGFDPDEWQRKFQDPAWTQAPPPQRATSPGKGGASARKQSQSKKAGKSGGWRGNGTSTEPHIVDDDDGDAAAGTGQAAQTEHEAPLHDVDAMDIDNPPPPAEQSETQPDSESSGARAYSVPPSQWRRQQEQKQRSHRKSSVASKKSQRADSSKFTAGLDDLRNVEPLGQASTAEESIKLADLGASLPFSSQASSTVFGEPIVPRNLAVPPLPKAPSEPQRLSRATWHSYAAAYGEYVKEFHAYNTALLQHFQEREKQVQAQMVTGMSWLEATGDTSGMLRALTGFGSYMRGVKEDTKVREAWMLAWEKHETAVLGFEKMRDRIRKLVIGGMLVDN
ncbi:hypothetical protein BDY17DRAFT_303261 [Neohortaea acidophila]|uniref:J domain-containing protein n=1 Tax=Neohortaea acidophila TaxID=245834 RepID=A0A6A6PJE9_9PEZI|nr:uncharacterized protein BDY17DRAFT_303261 [Neohortaea acidophila]KAF2480122.1 hypothetical protein BDY17DRAFT_303261 [Neohortaea acidophila]